MVDQKEPSYPFGCAVSVTLSVIGGRWKPVIIFLLKKNDVMRFGEFQKSIPKISKKMLTSQLRDLEKDGIICRTVYAEVPVKVEYTLTEYGKTLEDVVSTMCEWGKKHTKRLLNEE